VFEPLGDIHRLFSQAGSQHLSVVSVFEKCFFVADALDLVSNFQRTVVFAERKMFQFRSERTNQCAQIARVVLQVPNGDDARLAPVTIATLFAKFRFTASRKKIQNNSANISSVFLTKPIRGNIFATVAVCSSADMADMASSTKTWLYPYS